MSALRTKLKDRALPPYTPEEEKWNMLTHIAGGVVALIIGAMCILKASYINNNILQIVTCSIFVTSMLSVYTISSIYHAVTPIKTKKIMQIIDHCMIYFLIAGTYTPFLLCTLAKTRPDAAYITLSFVWAFAILATIFTAIDLQEYKVFSMICYIAIGWCIIFFLKDMYNNLTANGFFLLFGGGISYTIGAIFYGIAALKHVKFAHCIFHVFTLIGTVLQALSILKYVL